MKKQKEENKLVPIVIRVPKDKKTMIEKLAIKQGKSEAEVVRSGIDKELNLQTYRDNLDFRENSITIKNSVFYEEMQRQKRKTKCLL